MNNYKLVAMIPARLGSRRIVKKNIRYMLDKPLIQYPIDFALNSNRFESIWINTESKELGEACKRFGINFHERPAELANDKATNRDFVYEFLKNHDCDYVIMINPTSPTLRQETVNGFIDFVQEHDYDTVMSVISNQTEAIFKGEKINFDGSDKIPNDELEPIEEIVWAMTAWKKDTFIRLQESGQCPVFGGKLGTYPIPKDESADLDNEEDWRIAEGVLLARSTEDTREKKYMDL
ncbi:MAG: hypothetical protein PUB19_08655 [Lachnospiraceae bacterium]|nr:hypothetical protein [Lachnospiraceae bacterium]